MGLTDGPREQLLFAEAQERSRLLRVSAYDVELDVRPLLTGDHFSSRTSVRFSCLEPGAASFLDLSSRNVRRVLVNGAELSPAEVVEPTRVRLPALQADNEVVIEAEFAAGSSTGGLHRAVDPFDGLIYNWTDFEPFGAHHVYACFDQPDLRAPFRFSVLAPDAWRVISNSPVESVEDGCWTFEPTPPISTYLTVVCAGPYAERTATHGELRIGFHCRQSFAPHLDLDELAALTRAGLDHFTATFATPYPFAKYDHVFCPEMNGAMENAGCVTYTDQVIFRAPPSPALEQWRRSTVMHEMAHMWFGDLVTPVWWDDLWLKESFADWAAADALHRAFGDREAWADFLESKQYAYLLDAGSTTHPVSAEIDDVEAAVGRFDAISYQKGASLLKQLAALVGAAALEAGLGEYFRRHAWGNTRLGDLLGALGGHTGQDLHAWADAWVRSTGYPRLSLELRGGAEYEQVVLHQETPEGGAAGFPFVVGVGVYDLSADGRLSRRTRIDVRASAARTEIAELAGARRAAMLLVNDDDLAYAGVRLDEASLDTLLTAAHTLGEPLARGMCAAVAWDMVRAGELAVSDQVALIARMIATERSAFALEAIVGQGATAARWYAAQSDTDQLLSSLGDALLEAVLWLDEGDARLRPVLLGLCAVATTDRQLDEIERLHRDQTLDANVRWPALHRLLALDRAGAAEIEQLRVADPDPDVNLRVTAARAAMPRAEVKAELWAHVFATDVPMTAMSEIGACFWQPAHAEVIAPFGERWISEVERIDGEAEWQSAMGRARRMAPSTGIDESYVERLRDFAGHLQPAIGKTVREIADERERRLRARKAGVRPRLVDSRGGRASHS